MTEDLTTRDAIAATRRFNAATGTYAASARGNRVLITVNPATALRYADILAAALEADTDK